MGEYGCKRGQIGHNIQYVLQEIVNPREGIVVGGVNKGNIFGGYLVEYLEGVAKSPLQIVEIFGLNIKYIGYHLLYQIEVGITVEDANIQQSR